MLERITQPMTDAVIERPLTLVEKLRNRRKEWASNPHYWMDSNLISDVFNDVINIVKQHQSWRKMPSDEKPQDMQAYNLLLKNDSAEYPTLYSVGLFKEYASGHAWLSLVEAETYIDKSKILAWQPMNEPSNDFFEILQPPSEVQDD